MYVSVLYREPKLLKELRLHYRLNSLLVSVLYREPKLLKATQSAPRLPLQKQVSVLYREPKLLKAVHPDHLSICRRKFQCSTVSRNC